MASQPGSQDCGSSHLLRRHRDQNSAGRCAGSDHHLSRLSGTQSPLWNGTAGAEYERPVTPALNLVAAAHFRYRGSMYNQEGNSYPSAPYRPLDLSLGVADANGYWNLAGLVKNVNNSLSEDFASPSVAPNFAGLASPAPLRTVWLIATLHMK